MSIEDDVALLERVPTLRLLGTTALRMLAIGSEQRNIARGDKLFTAGDEADSGFIVQHGAFRIADEHGAEVLAGPGDLIGELALLVAMARFPTLNKSNIHRWIRYEGLENYRLAALVDVTARERAQHRQSEPRAGE